MTGACSSLYSDLPEQYLLKHFSMICFSSEASAAFNNRFFFAVNLFFKFKPLMIEGEHFEVAVGS